ncbi:MAG: hypothetical protein KBA46_05340 [Candidatus Omnitrophica bacterium]|nr:hypothetical protein [Candidatus Omnitrophota bacterium]
MEVYDFGISWLIPDDKDDLFIATLRSECELRKMSFIFVDKKNLDKLAADIQADKIKIKFFLDMASEIHSPRDEFRKFAYVLKDSGTRIVDDPDDVKAASDKSITHFDLIRSQVAVPYTVVIRKWEEARRLTDEEKEGLGFPFVIKPALGYALKGVKVINQKGTLKEIAEARKINPGDNFLLQEFIEPLVINDTPAWFRVYHLFGEIIPCWWNPTTHVYRQVTLKEMDAHQLLPLVRITSEIARITRIDWFSCEIAINKKNKEFVTIDYMNDQCAIVPQSLEEDGVPDDLVVHIASRIVDKAWQNLTGKFTLTYRAIWLPLIKVKDADV